MRHISNSSRPYILFYAARWREVCLGVCTHGWSWIETLCTLLPHAPQIVFYFRVCYILYVLTLPTHVSESVASISRVSLGHFLQHLDIARSAVCKLVSTLFTSNKFLIVSYLRCDKNGTFCSVVVSYYIDRKLYKRQIFMKYYFVFKCFMKFFFFGASGENLPYD